MPTPGVDVIIADEPSAGSAADAAETLYLLSTAGPATPTVKRKADTGDASTDKWLRAYFADGGRAVVVQGYGDGDPLPTLANALLALPSGAGQIVAPEVVASADIIAVAAAAKTQGKVYLANGPSGANDAALVTLAGLVVAGTDARFAGLFADTMVYAGVTPGSTDEVPLAVTVAALLARNDRTYLNPNIAPAGVRGESVALGILAERSDAARETLHDAQVNTAKTVNGRIRNYGFRSLADLDDLPQWWDLSGSRTVAVFRHTAAGIDEDVLFDQIDGQRILLDRYEGLLRSALKELYDKGALYGATPDDAYSVDTGPSVNPPEDLAAGEIKATVRLKVSPFAEHVETTIVRRALTATL